MGVEWDVADAVAALEALKEKARAATVEAATRGAQVIADQAQRNAPKRTGRLAGSIWPGEARQSGNSVSIQIAPRGVVYARIQELGGTITPKAGEYLTWHTGTQWVRKRQVTLHGHFYLSSALSESASDVQRVVRESWAKAFGG